MVKNLKTVAFDLGGVLATQDYSKLDTRETALVKAHLNRFNKDRVLLEASKGGSSDPDDFLREAAASIDVLWPKIHLMSDEGIAAIQTVKDMGLSPSIWTNNIWAIFKWFESIGLYDYVNPEYICNSIAMGQGNFDKPNPNFYGLALEQLKNDVADVLFFDDTLENVAAGLGYGIPSLHFDMDDKRHDEKSLSKITYQAVETINRNR